MRLRGKCLGTNNGQRGNGRGPLTPSGPLPGQTRGRASVLHGNGRGPPLPQRRLGHRFRLDTIVDKLSNMKKEPRVAEIARRDDVRAGRAIADGGPGPAGRLGSMTAEARFPIDGVAHVARADAARYRASGDWAARAAGGAVGE